MSLVNKTVNVPIATGVDTKIDRLVPSINLQEAVNGRFDKVGTIKKRNVQGVKNFKDQNGNLIANNGFDQSYRAVFNNRLFQVSPTEIHRYNDGLDLWEKTESEGVNKDPIQYKSTLISDQIKQKLGEGNELYTIDNLDCAIAGDYMLISYTRYRTEDIIPLGYNDYYRYLEWTPDQCYVCLYNTQTGTFYWKDVVIKGKYVRVLPAALPNDTTGIPAFNVLYVTPNNILKSALLYFQTDTSLYTTPNFDTGVNTVLGYSTQLGTSVYAGKFAAAFLPSNKGQSFAVVFQESIAGLVFRNTYFIGGVTLGNYEYTYSNPISGHSFSLAKTRDIRCDIAWIDASTVIYAFNGYVYRNSTLCLSGYDAPVLNLTVIGSNVYLITSNIGEVNTECFDALQQERKSNLMLRSIKVQQLAFNGVNYVFNDLKYIPGFSITSRSKILYTQTGAYTARSFTQTSEMIVSKSKREGAEYYHIDFLTGKVLNKIQTSEEFAGDTHYSYDSGLRNYSAVSYFEYYILPYPNESLTYVAKNQCIPLKQVTTFSIIKQELTDKESFKRLTNAFIFTGKKETSNFLNNTEGFNGFYVANGLIYKHGNSVSYNHFLYNPDWFFAKNNISTPTIMKPSGIERGEEYEYKVIFTHLDKENDLTRGRETFSVVVKSAPDDSGSFELNLGDFLPNKDLYGNVGLEMSAINAAKFTEGIEYDVLGYVTGVYNPAGTFLCTKKYTLANGNVYVVGINNIATIGTKASFTGTPSGSPGAITLEAANAGTIGNSIQVKRTKAFFERRIVTSPISLFVTGFSARNANLSTYRIEATSTGTAWNGIKIFGNGTSTVNGLIAAFNAANPSTTVSLISGDGNRIARADVVIELEWGTQTLNQAIDYWNHFNPGNEVDIVSGSDYTMNPATTITLSGGTDGATKYKFDYDDKPLMTQISFEAPYEFLKENVGFEVYRTKKLSSGDTNFYKITRFYTESTDVGTINNQLGLSFDNSCYTLCDATADDELGELLYTTGGVLNNYQPHSVLCVASGKNRMFFVTSQKRNRVYYSKPKLNNINYEFSEFLYLDINESDEITGLRVLDDKLIAFAKNAIYFTYGNGPSATGENGAFNPFDKVLSNTGCSEPMSIIGTDTGIWFKALNGLAFLNRGLQSSFKGLQMDDFKSFKIINSFDNPSRNEIYFEINVPNTGVGTFPIEYDNNLLVYNELQDKWSLFTGYYSGLGGSAGINPGFSHCLMYQNKIISFQKRTSLTFYMEDKSTFYNEIVITSKWLNLNDVLNYQRVRNMILLGNYKAAHTLKIQIYRNYAETVFQEKTFTRSAGTTNKNIIKLDFKDQQIRGFKIKIIENSNAEGFEMSSINFEFAVYPGQYRTQKTV